MTKVNKAKHAKIKKGLAKAFPNATTANGRDPQVEVADENEFTDTVNKNVTNTKGNSRNRSI